MAVTVAALLALVQRSERVEATRRDRRVWGERVVFAGAVGSSMLAWDGAPLPVLVPLGVYAVAVALVALGHDRPVPPVLAFLGVGLVSATALAVIPHLLWGWQERAAVVAPVLAGAGTVLVTAATMLDIHTLIWVAVNVEDL